MSLALSTDGNTAIEGGLADDRAVGAAKTNGWLVRALWLYPLARYRATAASSWLVALTSVGA